MTTANVRVLIYPLDSIFEPEQVILTAGQEFARQYALSEPNSIIREKNKKPRFNIDGVCYSVSHSGEFWVCAISDTPVGIDLQQHNICNAQSIARRFYHPDESAWTDCDDLSRFFLVWTAKESYVKYTGEGITDGFSDFSVVTDGRICGCHDTFFEHLTFREDYSLCLCTGIPAHITVTKK